MDQDSVRRVYEQYPWASEKTLEEALAHAGSRNAKLKQMVRTHFDMDLDELVKAMENNSSKLDKISATSKNVVKTTKDFISTLDRVDEPLTGAAAMMELGAKAVDGSMSGIGAIAGKIPYVGVIVGGLSTATGKTAVVGAATAAMFAKIASQQDKVIRSMIDMGYVTSNLDQYTDIRRFVSSFGMTIEEFISESEGLSGMFANNENGIMQGIGGFSAFLAEARQMAKDGLIPSYGYSPKEIGIRLIEEAEQLYMLGEIEQLDSKAKKKIIENFQKSTETASYLGSEMSEQRSALLRTREEVSANLSFRRALMVNSTELSNQFGDNYEELLRERISTITSMNESIFGKGEFSDTITNSFYNFLGNYAFDQTMINDIDPAFRVMIDKLGALPEFTKVTELLAQTDVAPEDLIQAQNDFIRALANNAQGQRALSPEERDLQARAQNVLALLPKADAQYQSNIVESLKQMQSANSESIQVEGEAQIAYAQLRDTLEPGFNTIVGGLEGFSKALQASVTAMGEIFGIDVLQDQQSTKTSTETESSAAENEQDEIVPETPDETRRGSRRRRRQRGRPSRVETDTSTQPPSATDDTTSLMPSFDKDVLEHSLIGNDVSKLALVSSIFKFSKQYGIDPALAIAIAEKESNFNIRAVGDKHLSNKAYGAFQMRKPALDEIYNRYGVRFTEQDMFDPAKAAQAGIMYMATQKDYYGARNNNDIARMYNGGPKGTIKSATIGYGNSVVHKTRLVQKQLNNDPITLAELNRVETELAQVSGNIVNAMQTENLQELQYGR